MYSAPFDSNTDQFQNFEDALSEIVTMTMALKSDLDKSDLRPEFV
jgi:hypothetical protein